MDDIGFLARQFFEPAEHHPVFQGQTFQRTANQAPFGIGDFLVRMTTPVTDRFGHIVRGEKGGRIGIDKGPERSGVAGDLGQQTVVIGGSVTLERFATLLHQP